MSNKQWQIMLVKIEGGTDVINGLGPKNTVKDLFEKVSKEVGLTLDEIRLLCGTKELRVDQKASLKECGLQNMCSLFLVARLKGGRPPKFSICAEKQEAFKRNEKLKALPGKVALTDDQCLYFLDDDSQTKRARMPCGHAISAYGMTMYCRSILTNDGYIFPCASGTCDKKWEFELVKHVACLDADEVQSYEKRMTQNYLDAMSGIRNCPGCKNYCSRKSPRDQRVVCPFCTKAGRGKPYEFCWECLREWRECTNPHCKRDDPRLIYLKNCVTKTIGKVNDCPSIRACVKCGMLIFHEAACKHMKCTNCKQSFCFVCLKTPNPSGGWPCGRYNSPCESAPVQAVIPSSG